MISGQTNLVGLLGNPVKHSLSPVMHNAALKVLNIDWCYLAMPCETKGLGLLLEALNNIGCKGLNITIPHKNAAALHCRELSPLANRLKAVNTLIPMAKGGWKGVNTDVEGFLSPLKAKNLEGKKAMVIGCGGSAKAVIEGLQELKLSQITIVGRKEVKINNCLQDFQRSENNSLETSLFGLIETDQQLINKVKSTDLIINTTPVGMTSYESNDRTKKQMPVDSELWKNLLPSTILYDLIYTPKTTTWLNYGKEQGCEIINGLEMLVQQGAASLKLWTGIEDIPISIMRNAAINTLKQIT